MPPRNRYYWVKLMMGTVLGILVVDVLVLAVLVVPLRASPQVSARTRDLRAGPTQMVANQVIMIPTHDPSKPRPIRTPTPTATPWLVAAVRLAAQRQAELASVRNAAMAAASSVGAVPAPGPGDTPVPTMSSPMATSASAGTVDPTATTQVEVTPAGTPSPTLEAPSSAGSSDIVSPPASVAAETSDAPTSVPSPTLSPSTPEPSPSETQGDEAQFTAYVEGHYNTIADQPLEIVSVTFVHPEAGILLVTVEVSAGVWNNVLAAQTADVIADYGRRLLNDTKSYFNGQSYSVNVVSKYETSDTDGCTSSPSWCYLGGYNQAGQAWSVVWTYVIGTSTEGSDSIQTWNAGQ
jgi:hypothetical protein